MRQLDELFKTCHGISGSDRFPGQLNSVAQACGFTAYDKTGSGVQEDDVAACAFPVGENLSDDRGVLCGVASLDGGNGSARYAEILRGNVVGAYFPSADLGDFAFSADGDLVQSVGTVNDEGALRSKLAEHLRHHLGKILVIDSEDLSRSTGRIADRAKEIEDRADFHLPPGKHDMPHSFVQEWSKQKTDSCFVDAARNRFGRQVDTYAQRFDNIGTPAKARDAPVAVLGDTNARSGYDKCSGR